MRILLAEDDHRLGKMLKTMLEKDNFQVEWVISGKTAKHKILNTEYDMLILDWMLPEVSGIEICRLIRSYNEKCGIIIITARDNIEDRILGLDIGADDYIIKPFTYKELWARVRSVSRRGIINESSLEEVFRINDLDINLTAHFISRNNQEIYLTNREFQVFNLLVLNYGNLVTREEFLSNIWGDNYNISPCILDNIISNIRRKVENHIRIIHAVRGQGYKMEKINA